MRYSLTVNGVPRDVDSAWLGESLLWVLRERLGLPGSKNACEQGECGSCSVLVDGTLLCACLVLAASAVDHEVVTVEGLSLGRGDQSELTDVQQAFVDAGAVQCGFCTPGLVLSVHDLLERSPSPDDWEIREAISGNLCRCTGYGRILEAVRRVADQRAGQDPTSQQVVAHAEDLLRTEDLRHSDDIGHDDIGHAQEHLP